MEALKDFYINYDELKETVNKKQDYSIWDLLENKTVSVSEIRYGRICNEVGRIICDTDGRTSQFDSIPRYYKSNPFLHLETKIEYLEQEIRIQNTIIDEMKKDLGKERVNYSKEKIEQIITDWWGDFIVDKIKDRNIKQWIEEKYPSLTFSEPFKERVMMVSDDKEEWKERLVIFHHEVKGYLAEKKEHIYNTPLWWKYAKEIEPITEYTLEQAIEALAKQEGKEVKQIKIKG